MLKTIFLGYPFKLTYIRQAVEAAASGHAKVVTASDVLRGQPLIKKIEELMAEADLCIFDLTTHNANVALEFGIAYARNHKHAILYCTNEDLNPKPGSESSVFSDVRGWDSLLYTDPLDLELRLKRYLPELLVASMRDLSGIVHVARPVGGSHGIRPRLNAKVRTINPGFMAVNDGPVAKLGQYSIGFEVWNAGRGIANSLRVAVTGMTEIQRYSALDVGRKNGVTFS